MSDYQQFLAERDKIDFLIQKGYHIKAVNENLSGAFVEFENGNANEDNKTLHIQTADARKYFSSLIIQQKAKASS